MTEIGSAVTASKRLTMLPLVVWHIVIEDFTCWEREQRHPFGSGQAPGRRMHRVRV